MVYDSKAGPVAQRITRLTTDQKIAGSNPAWVDSFVPNSKQLFYLSDCQQHRANDCPDQERPERIVADSAHCFVHALHDADTLGQVGQLLGGGCVARVEGGAGF